MKEVRISKEMKEHIGMSYISAMDISPDVKIIGTRRLLTLLSAATKLDGDIVKTRMILTSINECEQAISEYADSVENWAHACWICNKILDRVTPLIYDGYAIINDKNMFSLHSVAQPIKEDK